MRTHCFVCKLPIKYLNLYLHLHPNDSGIKGPQKDITINASLINNDANNSLF